MVRFGRKAPQMEAGYSATVLVNLAARGVGDAFPAERIRAYLERQGVETRLEFPDSPAEMTRAASRAASRTDRLLFVVGGDGTLRVAAEGIERSETALAALPRGTVNVWARETGIPRGLRAAIDTHLAGRVVPMDLGVANGHRFLPRFYHLPAMEEPLIFQVDLSHGAVTEAGLGGDAAALGMGSTALAAVPMCDVDLPHQSHITDDEDYRFQLPVTVYGHEQPRHSRRLRAPGR